eukprot:3980965-Amphidinium_carterae.1
MAHNGKVCDCTMNPDSEYLDNSGVFANSDLGGVLVVFGLGFALHSDGNHEVRGPTYHVASL